LSWISSSIDHSIWPIRTLLYQIETHSDEVLAENVLEQKIEIPKLIPREIFQNFCPNGIVLFIYYSHKSRL